MASSGVTCSDGVRDELKKLGKGVTALIEIEDGLFIFARDSDGKEYERIRRTEEDLKTILEGRFKAEPVFVVFEFVLRQENTGDVTKQISLFWCPDNSKIKPKMIFASSWNSLKPCLPSSLSKHRQVSDFSDVEDIIKEIKSKT